MPQFFISRRMCLAAAAACLAGAAQAQEFPSRPITIIVPYPAGGIVDALTRVLAEPVSKALGQPVVVDARPGANGNIGMQAGMRAAPDGYTWTFAATAFTVNSVLYKGLWDPLKDAQGVAAVVTAPSLVTAAGNLGVGSLKELVDLAKRQPGKLNFGNPGNGTSQHLNFELFRQDAGIVLTSIPYKGQPPVMTDMIRGEVQVSVNSVGVAAPHVAAGKVKALAVFADRRVPTLPDVPTVAEAGYPGANVVPWYGYVVPAATPRAVVARINAALNAAVQLPEVQAKLRAMGMEPSAPRTPEQVNALLKADFERFKVAIAAGNITAD